MRSDDEIFERIRELAKNDLFQWETNLLITFLPYTMAHTLLGERGQTPTDKWVDQDRSREALLAKIRAYMEIAVEMVIRHRGKKSQRSIDYLRAWIWLMGDEEMIEFMDTPENYPQFGAPVLKEVCRRYDIPWPGEHPGLQRMAMGDGCQPGGCPFNACVPDWRESAD